VICWQLLRKLQLFKPNDGLPVWRSELSFQGENLLSIFGMQAGLVVGGFGASICQLLQHQANL
jgi:hypothetical protein